MKKAGILATLALAAFVSTGCQSTPQKYVPSRVIHYLPEGGSYELTPEEIESKRIENHLEIEAGIRKHNAGIDRRNAERSQGFCSNYDTSRTDARVQEAREDTDYWEWTGQMYGNPYLNLPGSQVLLPLSTFMGNQAKKTEKRVEYDAIRAEIRARSR